MLDLMPAIGRQKAVLWFCRKETVLGFKPAQRLEQVDDEESKRAQD